MIGTYFDGDTLDQAFDCYCQSGRSSDQLQKLAEQLGIEPDDLLQRWGLPATKPVAETPTAEFDLWAVDRLDSIL